MRRIGTTCMVAPAAAYSSASRAADGTATWHSHPAATNWRIIRISAVSEPPPSLAGWMDRRHLVRIAVNVEQLLSRSPGGIGRYSGQLVTLLSALPPTDEVVPFVARHPPAAVHRA